MSGDDTLPGFAMVASTIIADAPAPASPPEGDGMQSLEERRATVRVKLEQLRAGRADAALRGENVDNLAAGIAAAEAELAALDEAEQLAHDRSRAAGEETMRRHNAALRGAIGHHAKLRLDAIAAAQAAFEAAAAELRKAGDALDEIKRITGRLGDALPQPLHATEAATRLSRRVAASLAGLVRGHLNRYGVISWGSLPWSDQRDWSKAEAAATRAALQALTRSDEKP